MTPVASSEEPIDQKSDHVVVDEEEADEYEDAEKNYQPKSLKFWSIMMSLYLSVFIVALVSCISPLWN
jgi:hypothetical protein